MNSIFIRTDIYGNCISKKKQSLSKYLSTEIYYMALLKMQLKINREKSKR